MEEGDKDLPAKLPFQTVVSGAGPLSRSELDMFDKKHVLRQRLLHRWESKVWALSLWFFISKYFFDLIDEAEYLAACAVLFSWRGQWRQF